MMYLKRIRIALRLFRRAYANQKHKLVIMTLFGMLGGLMGGIGIGTIIPLFSFIVPGNTSLGTTSDTISQGIKSIFSFLHLPYTLPVLLGFMAILFIGKAAFLYAGSYIHVRTALDYERDTRARLLRNTLYASWPHLLNQKSGYLESILIDDVFKSSGILSNFTGAILTATSFLMYAVIAFNISATITIITFVIGLLSFIIFKPLMSRVRRLSVKASKNTKEVVHHVSEHIAGIKTVKSAAVEPWVMQKSKHYFEELHHAGLWSFIYNNIFISLIEPITFFIVASIFLFSYSRPNFNIASLAAIMYLVQKMFSYVQNIQGKFNAINEHIPYLKNVTTYQREARNHAELDSGTLPFSFQTSLTIDDVSFFYRADVPLLTNIQLTVTRGSTVGIIGPSGAGYASWNPPRDILLWMEYPLETFGLLIGANILVTWLKICLCSMTLLKTIFDFMNPK